MLLKNLTIAIGSLSFAALTYLYYVRRCYKYLKSLGYDGPAPKYLIGSLLEFVSKDNSVSTDSNKPAISHYSKTLQRWTKIYGKIYGYYEGHSPVLVIADPDLVTEVFVNQNKLLSHRRSFPMSKSSNDPNADIFINNGIRWLRVRYGLEKVMLNNKNTSQCLRYADDSFINTFVNQSDFSKPQSHFDILHQAKLFMIQSMFCIIFGTNLNKFIQEKPAATNNKINGTNNVFLQQGLINKSNLYYTRIIENKFGEAFNEFESFSLLKFIALMVPELGPLWRGIEKFKRVFNTYVFRLSYFADPMDWFYSNFINKQLLLYIQDQEMQKSKPDDGNSLVDHLNFNPNNVRSTRFSRGSRFLSYSQSAGMPKRSFSYFNSFLFLTYNPIVKYHLNETQHRKASILPDLPLKKKRTLTSSDRLSSTSSLYDSKPSKQRMRSLSSLSNLENNKTKSRHYSTDYWNKDSDQARSRIKSTNILANDIESEDFENWKLTINEALSNTLLMFFAGFETTSTAIGFCCKVLATLPEQQDKLLEEINDNWETLNFNLAKYNITPIKINGYHNKNNEGETEESESDSTLNNDSNDDVFEDDKNTNQKDAKSSNTKTNANKNLDEWNDLYESLEKLKYLDMFVKEVLRMFPIANSMVSRKCVVDNLIIDNGNYYIPKGMNIVVDVLSIHYDPVIWGPVDPEVFYPERFLTERNPAAWLPFGIGARKCLGMKLAISQIKLFVVRLLQNYTIGKCKSNKLDKSNSNLKISETIETKDILFCSPVNGIYVSLETKT